MYNVLGGPVGRQALDKKINVCFLADGAVVSKKVAGSDLFVVFFQYFFFSPWLSPKVSFQTIKKKGANGADTTEIFLCVTSTFV